MGDLVPSDRTDIHRALASDHERLEHIFRELENAVEGADQPTIQRDWTDFECGVLAHFEAEERLIFPLLEVEHAAEVKRAKEDHERVRALLATLGVRTDLHLLRNATDPGHRPRRMRARAKK